MGEAMLSAVINKGLSTPENICVADISRERLGYLKNRYNVAVTETSHDAVSNKNAIILAVKPQNLVEVLSDLKGYIQPNQLVISIIAGVKIDTLCQGLEHSSVVRVMPNTPTQVGYGMSAWTTSVEVSNEQKEQARIILEAMGREIYFEDEKYLDMATALSASGPAYFFLLAESLVAAGVEIGLSQQEAEELVSQTMLGSAQLMQTSDVSPAQLRQNVTSRGGTTERALQVFSEAGFSDIVKKAVRAAYERAKELGS